MLHTQADLGRVYRHNQSQLNVGAQRIAPINIFSQSTETQKRQTSRV
jgi:hypothetical protein